MSSMNAQVPFTADSLTALPGWTAADLWSYVQLPDAKHAVTQLKHRHDAERIAIIPAAKIGRCGTRNGLFDHFEQLHALLAPPIPSAAAPLSAHPDESSEGEGNTNHVAAAPSPSPPSLDLSPPSKSPSLLSQLRLTVGIRTREAAKARDSGSWFSTGGSSVGAQSRLTEVVLHISLERPSPPGRPVWKTTARRTWPQLLALVDHMRESEPGLWLPPFPREVDASIGRRDSAVDPAWLATRAISAIQANPTTLGSTPLTLSFLFDTEDTFDVMAGWTRAWDASVERERTALIAAASPVQVSSISAWISSWTGASSGGGSTPAASPSAVALAAIAAQNAPITGEWLQIVQNRALGYSERHKRYAAAEAAAKNLDAALTEEIKALDHAARAVITLLRPLKKPSQRQQQGSTTEYLREILGVDDDDDDTAPSVAVPDQAIASAFSALVDQCAGIDSLSASLIAHTAAAATEARESSAFCEHHLRAAKRYEDEWGQTVECERRGQQRSSADLATARRCLTHEVLLLRSSVDAHAERGLRVARERTLTDLFAATVMAASLGRKVSEEPSWPFTEGGGTPSSTSPCAADQGGAGYSLFAPRNKGGTFSIIDDGTGNDLAVDWEEEQ